jgi:hypothetical protein
MAAGIFILLHKVWAAVTQNRTLIWQGTRAVRDTVTQFCLTAAPGRSGEKTTGTSPRQSSKKRANGPTRRQEGDRPAVAGQRFHPSTFIVHSCMLNQGTGLGFVSPVLHKLRRGSIVGSSQCGLLQILHFALAEGDPDGAAYSD